MFYTEIEKKKKKKKKRLLQLSAVGGFGIILCGERETKDP